MLPGRSLCNGSVVILKYLLEAGYENLALKLSIKKKILVHFRADCGTFSQESNFTSMFLSESFSKNACVLVGRQFSACSQHVASLKTQQACPNYKLQIQK